MGHLMSFLKKIGKNITVGDVKTKNILENCLESFLYSCSNSDVEKNNTGFHFLELLSKNLCDQLNRAPQIFLSKLELVGDIPAACGYLCAVKTKWLFKDHF